MGHFKSARLHSTGLEVICRGRPTSSPLLSPSCSQTRRTERRRKRPCWRVLQVRLTLCKLSPGIILCGWQGSKHQRTNQCSVNKTDNFTFSHLKVVWNDREHFSQFQIVTDALPFHIYLPVCLWIMDPQSRAAKKETSHGNEVPPQDTRHLM